MAARSRSAIRLEPPALASCSRSPKSYDAAGHVMDLRHSASVREWGSRRFSRGSIKREDLSMAHAAIPDIRDGLTRQERIVLRVLSETQKERGDRPVPTAMLWGRVCEHFYMSP